MAPAFGYHPPTAPWTPPEALDPTMLRWNLSSLGRDYARADGFVVSIPKCGRTWFRVLFDAYGCIRAGQEPRTGTDVLPALGLPHVRFTHDRWEVRTSRWWDRVRGKHLVAAGQTGKPIVLLVRDPRDVIVSLYHHLSKRDQRFEGSLGQFLRHGVFGVEGIVGDMNAWWREWGAAENVLLVRYEDCRAETARELRRMTEHLGFGSADPAALDSAVEFASFDNMKAMERRGEFREGFLRTEPGGDANAFKVRSGKVGGYREVLSTADQDFVDAACARLEPVFGYDAIPVA